MPFFLGLIKQWTTLKIEKYKKIKSSKCKNNTILHTHPIALNKHMKETKKSPQLNSNRKPKLHQNQNKKIKYPQHIKIHLN